MSCHYRIWRRQSLCRLQSRDGCFPRSHTYLVLRNRNCLSLVRFKLRSSLIQCPANPAGILLLYGEPPDK